MISKLIYSAFACILVALPLSFIAGYQIIGESRDYLNYLAFFDLIRFNPDGLDFSYRFEPGFTLVTYLLTRLDISNELTYSFIAGFAILIKYLSIPVKRKYWLSFLVFTYYFLSRYFLLFEMTVLRAACAFALVFSVFIDRDSEERSIRDVIILVFAVTFHYSAAVILPIYFFKNLSRRLVLLVSMSTFLIIFLLEPLVISSLRDYIAVFETYDDLTAANVLPLAYLVDLIYLSIFIWFWEENDLAMRYAILGILLGAAFHFSLFEYSIFASRFRELFSVFILIHITRASISDSKFVKYTSLIYVFFTGLVHLYIAFVYDPLLS